MSDELEKKADKRQGRYIKGSSPLMKTISIEEFNFAKIAAPDMIYPDNKDFNIIHARLHPKKSLEKGAKPHPTMDLSLTQEKIGIIPPRNFTAEWNEHKKRFRNKDTKNLDDDEDEFLFGNFLKQSEAALPPPPNPKIELPVQETQPPEAHLEPADSVLKIKRDLPPQEEHPTVEFLEPPVPSYEEEKARGYEEGLREGSEKARLDFESKLQTMTQEFTKVMEETQKEWGEKQKTILDSYPQKMKELVLALTESILNKQISLNPSQFLDLLVRAINETLPQEETTVLVSEEWFSRLSQLDPNPIKQRLKVDPTRKGTSFKIDSPRSSIEGNLASIVEDLLKQVDWNDILKKGGE